MHLSSGESVAIVVMSKRRIPKRAAKSIASERIEILFDLTEKEARKGKPERAKRYLELALRMGMRHKVSVSLWKRRFCPACKNYYQFPNNASVRLKKGRIVITCNSCGNVARYPYKG